MGHQEKAPNPALSAHSQWFQLAPPTQKKEDARSDASFLFRHAPVAAHIVEMPTRIPSRAGHLAKYRGFSPSSMLWHAPARRGEFHACVILHIESLSDSTRQ